MNVQEVYKKWASNHYGVNCNPKDIEKVEFSSYQNDYDPHAEFDTFNGCEMWSMTLHMKDGSTNYVNLWDMNPAGSIAYYAESNGLSIEFDPPEPPSIEELVELDLRRD